MGIAEAACAALALLAPLAADEPDGAPATASVVLRWAAVPGATAYDVQIASDPGFSSLAVAERIPEASYRWRRTPTRPFHWRVRSVDGAGRPGAWSGVRSIAPAVGPPSLRAPDDGAHEAAGAVDLSCEPSPLLRSYVVEIARDPAFAQRVAEDAQPACAFHLSLPEAGRFHWRVRGLTAAGDSTPPSPGRALALRPGAPDPIAPEHGEIVPFAPVILRWSPVRGATEYRIAVEAPEGRRAWTVRDPETRLAPERPGAHAWTVAAGAGDVPGPESPARAFEVDVVAPALESPPEGEVLKAAAIATVDLAWASVPGAAAYTVEIVRDGSGEVAWHGHADGVRARAELSPGAYRWSVAGRTASGRLGPPSEPRRLAIELLPPSPEPPAVPAAGPPAGPAPPPPPSSWLRAGIAGAWRTNFGRFSRPGPSIEIAARRALATGAVGISLRVSWFDASATVPASGALPAPMRASARLFPLALLATVERQRGAFAFYGGAGVAAWIARLESGGEALARVAPGAEALVGAARRLRSGEAFVEVGGALGELSTRVLRMRTGGAFAAAGWRVDL